MEIRLQVRTEIAMIMKIQLSNFRQKLPVFKTELKVKANRN